MSTRVIIPPEPIVMPGDVPGAHAADDQHIAAMIAAATAEIDGADGWVGRAFGPQTLEWSGWSGCERIVLPCRPIIKIVSVITEDRDGSAQPVDPSAYRRDGDYLVPATGAAWAHRPLHRIRYEAGYDGHPVADGGTGDVPAQVKQAIVLAVQHMMALSADNLFLRSEDVEGIGSRTYTVSEQAGQVIRHATNSLLSGLRVYR